MAIKSSSVRFGDESKNTVHRYDAPENPSSLWISKESRQKSEYRAKEAGKETMLNGIALLLDGTFAKPHLESQRCLDEFVRNSGARGLERVICESHFNERKHYKAQLYRSVFEAQEMARKNDWHPGKLRERVRELSMKNSYRGKVFARKMALADEAAACSSVSEKKEGLKRRSTNNNNNNNPLTSNPMGGMARLVRQQSYDGGRCTLALLGCF